MCIKRVGKITDPCDTQDGASIRPELEFKDGNGEMQGIYSGHTIGGGGGYLPKLKQEEFEGLYNERKKEKGKKAEREKINRGIKGGNYLKFPSHQKI